MMTVVRFFRSRFAISRTSLISAILMNALVASAATGASKAAEDPAISDHVDVLIVLATDVSGSIDDGQGGAPSEYLLQREGIVKALRDPEVAQVLEQCNAQGAGITYMEWSGENFRPMTQQRVPWRVLRNRVDLNHFADEIENIGGRSSMGSTDVVSALRASAELLLKAPLTASRRIISLSSDGEHNVGEHTDSEMHASAPDKLIQSLQAERDRILALDIVIDALVIQNDVLHMGSATNLEEYYHDNVIGGPGSRVVPVSNFEEYADGLKQKLLSELDNCLM